MHVAPGCSTFGRWSVLNLILSAFCTEHEDTTILVTFNSKWTLDFLYFQMIRHWECQILIKGIFNYHRHMEQIATSRWHWSSHKALKMGAFKVITMNTGYNSKEKKIWPVESVMFVAKYLHEQQSLKLTCCNTPEKGHSNAHTVLVRFLTKATCVAT